MNRLNCPAIVEREEAEMPEGWTSNSEEIKFEKSDWIHFKSHEEQGHEVFSFLYLLGKDPTTKDYKTLFTFDFNGLLGEGQGLPENRINCYYVCVGRHNEGQMVKVDDETWRFEPRVYFRVKNIPRGCNLFAFSGTQVAYKCSLLSNYIEIVNDTKVTEVHKVWNWKVIAREDHFCWGERKMEGVRDNGLKLIKGKWYKKVLPQKRYVRYFGCLLGSEDSGRETVIDVTSFPPAAGFSSKFIKYWQFRYFVATLNRLESTPLPPKVLVASNYKVKADGVLSKRDQWRLYQGFKGYDFNQNLGRDFLYWVQYYSTPVREGTLSQGAYEQNQAYTVYADHPYLVEQAIVRDEDANHFYTRTSVELRSLLIEKWGGEEKLRFQQMNYSFPREAKTLPFNKVARNWTSFRSSHTFEADKLKWSLIEQSCYSPLRDKYLTSFVHSLGSGENEPFADFYVYDFRGFEKKSPPSDHLYCYFICVGEHLAGSWSQRDFRFEPKVYFQAKNIPVGSFLFAFAGVEVIRNLVKDTDSTYLLERFPSLEAAVNLKKSRSEYPIKSIKSFPTFSWGQRVTRSLTDVTYRQTTITKVCFLDALPERSEAPQNGTGLDFVIDCTESIVQEPYRTEFLLILGPLFYGKYPSDSSVDRYLKERVVVAPVAFEEEKTKDVGKVLQKESRAEYYEHDTQAGGSLARLCLENGTQIFDEVYERYADTVYYDCESKELTDERYHQLCDEKLKEDFSTEATKLMNEWEETQRRMKPINTQIRGHSLAFLRLQAKIFAGEGTDQDRTDLEKEGKAIEELRKSIKNFSENESHSLLRDWLSKASIKAGIKARKEATEVTEAKSVKWYLGTSPGSE